MTIMKVKLKIGNRIKKMMEAKSQNINGPTIGIYTRTSFTRNFNNNKNNNTWAQAQLTFLVLCFVFFLGNCKGHKNR